MRAATLVLIAALAACDDDGSKKDDARKDDASGKDDADGAKTPGVLARLEQARIDTACVEAQSLASAVEMAIVSEGTCPASLQALVDSRLIPELRPDPWGTAYDLVCADDKVTITSRGPDRTAGTEDDVAFGEGATSCAP